MSSDQQHPPASNEYAIPLSRRDIQRQEEQARAQQTNQNAYARSSGISSGEDRFMQQPGMVFPEQPQYHGNTAAGTTGGQKSSQWSTLAAKTLFYSVWQWIWFFILAVIKFPFTGMKSKWSPVWHCLFALLAFIGGLALSLLIIQTALDLSCSRMEWFCGQARDISHLRQAIIDLQFTASKLDETADQLYRTTKLQGRLTNDLIQALIDMEDRQKLDKHVASFVLQVHNFNRTLLVEDIDTDQQFNQTMNQIVEYGAKFQKHATSVNSALHILSKSMSKDARIVKAAKQDRMPDPSYWDDILKITYPMETSLNSFANDMKDSQEVASAIKLYIHKAQTAAEIESNSSLIWQALHSTRYTGSGKRRQMLKRRLAIIDTLNNTLADINEFFRLINGDLDRLHAYTSNVVVVVVELQTGRVTSTSEVERLQNLLRFSYD